MKFYLEQLICALNDADIEQLASIDLRKSKIRSYLEILIANRKKGIPDKEFIKEKLDLDENSFKKIRSEILSKCLVHLVPEGGIKLLYFLSRRRLPELFRREAAELIKRTDKDKHLSNEERGNIYLHTIIGYLRLPYGLFDEKKLENYFNGFIQYYSLPDKPIVSAVIKLNKLFVLIVRSFFALEVSEENYTRFTNELRSIEKEVGPLKNKRVVVLMEAIHLIVDFYYRSNWAELQEKFEKLAEAYKELNTPDTHDELMLMRFYVAYNQFMLNNFQKANELLHQIELDYAGIVHYFPHLTFRYALSLLMAGENEKCKTLIDSSLKESILNYDNDGSIMSCLVYTAYHLLENELEEASRYIKLFWSIIDKKELMSFETAMRLFEIIFYFQNGDDVFAATLLKKFTRFLYDKSDKQSTRNTLVLVKSLLLSFNRFLKRRTDITRLENELNDLFAGNRVIGSLLFINAVRIRSKGLNKLTQL